MAVSKKQRWYYVIMAAACSLAIFQLLRLSLYAASGYYNYGTEVRNLWSRLSEIMPETLSRITPSRSSWEIIMIACICASITFILTVFYKETCVGKRLPISVACSIIIGFECLFIILLDLFRLTLVNLLTYAIRVNSLYQWEISSVLNTYVPLRNDIETIEIADKLLENYSSQIYLSAYIEASLIFLSVMIPVIILLRRFMLKKVNCS